MNPLAAPGSRTRPISLHFPCRSGICAQRRVRHRLGSPPSSLRLRGSSSRSVAWPPKTPWFRGVLGEGSGEPEPETVGSGRGSRCIRESSLLPSSAVRIRFPSPRREYRSSEFHSLRHLVCISGELAPGGPGGPRKRRTFAGFCEGRSEKPKRRPALGPGDPCLSGDRLQRRSGRFGMRAAP